MTFETGTKFYVHKTQGHLTYRTPSDGDRYPIPGDYRPVVLIDPEDREGVVRLLDLYWGNDGVPYDETEYPEYATDMQAALRAFAAPKPEEPMGLGAVVVDATGRRWVRDLQHSLSPNQWLCADNEAATRRVYRDITARGVLSPGVPVE